MPSWPNFAVNDVTLAAAAADWQSRATSFLHGFCCSNPCQPSAFEEAAICCQRLRHRHVVLGMKPTLVKATGVKELQKEPLESTG